MMPPRPFVHALCTDTHQYKHTLLSVLSVASVLVYGSARARSHLRAAVTVPRCHWTRGTLLSPFRTLTHWLTTRLYAHHTARPPRTANTPGWPNFCVITSGMGKCCTSFRAAILDLLFQAVKHKRSNVKMYLLCDAKRRMFKVFDRCLKWRLK